MCTLLRCWSRDRPSFACQSSAGTLSINAGFPGQNAFRGKTQTTHQLRQSLSAARGTRHDMRRCRGKHGTYCISAREACRACELTRLVVAVLHQLELDGEPHQNLTSTHGRSRGEPEPLPSSLHAHCRVDPPARPCHPVDESSHSCHFIRGPKEHVHTNVPKPPSAGRSGERGWRTWKPPWRWRTMCKARPRGSGSWGCARLRCSCR
jgi:hypothetical protein